MIYPLKLLQIETTNLCNSNCIFCIHSSLKNLGTMSDELFLKILKDAKKIPTLETIIPMMLGEPFVDKKMISRLKLINKILPGKKIEIFTNISLITPKIIEQLKEIDNTTMIFSLNGYNKETRKKLMGLDDYDHCVEMIDLYVKTGKPYFVSMIMHPSVSDREIEDFKKNSKWNITISEYKNWSGDKFDAPRQTHCRRAISEMTIMWNGKVNLCCMEYGKVIFGDINKESVLSVWESKHRQMYARMHSQGEWMKGVCSNCTKA